MSKSSDKPNEFRRYRQALAAIYLATIALGFGLLAVSVVKQLLFRRPAVQLEGPALSAENPDPRDMLRCNDDVHDLYEDLPRFTAQLLRSPTRGKQVQVGAEWENFSRKWLYRWDEVNARCRFSELRDSDMGLAYDRMANVHGDLPALRLKYQSLVVRFDDEQAAELARMRRALDKSREALNKLAPASGGTDSTEQPR